MKVKHHKPSFRPVTTFTNYNELLTLNVTSNLISRCSFVGTRQTAIPGSANCPRSALYISGQQGGSCCIRCCPVFNREGPVFCKDYSENRPISPMGKGGESRFSSLLMLVPCSVEPWRSLFRGWNLEVGS